MKDIKCLAFLLGMFFFFNIVTSLASMMGLDYARGAYVFSIITSCFLAIIFLKYAATKYQNQDDDEHEGKKNEKNPKTRPAKKNARNEQKSSVKDELKKKYMWKMK